MLSYEDMMVEYAKGYKDKSRIYFIEHTFTTFNADVRKSTPFMLFPRQKVFLQTISEKPNVIAIKHRQCGITTVSSAWAAAQCVFCESESKETILAIANKMDLATQIVDKVRDFLLQVPRWYWGDDYYSPDPSSPKNKKDIFVKNSKQELELFNGCKVFARSSGENAARGISAASILIFDEAAFIENGPAVYASAVAASASVKDSKIIMVSTPNGKDLLYYNTYHKAIIGENNFTPVEFKWYQDLRYNRNLKWYKKDPNSGEIQWIEEEVINKRGNVRYDEERWRKLEQEGWTATSPWYEDMCKSFNNDTMKIAQELDVSFMGSSNNVVQPEIIEMHNKINVREPLTDFKDPYVEATWFWKEPIEGHRYICACLPKGEQVMTQKGLVNVEDVQADDLLITNNGKYTKIKHRKYREVENEKIISIETYGSIRQTKFTWNHPIWASLDSKYKKKYIGKFDNKEKWQYYWKHNFNFVNAENLKENDWIEYPNIYHINEINEAEILTKWEKYQSNRFQNHTINNPLLDEEFWWYCGIWLAEGYVHVNKKTKIRKIQTTHHINETEYHQRIYNLCKRLFGRNAWLMNYENEHTTKIAFISKQIGDFLTDTFGKYAHGKFISEWVKCLPKKYKMKLIEGYFNGDGWFDKTSMRVESVSYQLLEDVRDILFSLGVTSSIKKGKKPMIKNILGRLCNKRQTYVLAIGELNSIKFAKMCGFTVDYKPTTSSTMKYMYFSEDLTKIYMKIRKVEEFSYSGKVYNYETEDESHTFVTKTIPTHNCDASTGSSNDFTAIEIIDMDGVDENGFPIIEQVAEYHGKKHGDEIGEIVFNYATMYNNALVVVDCVGGFGDLIVITLMNLGYKNLYYDDQQSNKYLMQTSYSKLALNNDDRLPGFRNNSVRFQMLSGFAQMLKNNEFKIRSKRVITELETWIFKGESGRMDHMDGMHDDTITCLAMGLFVMKYSFNKLQNIKSKDAAILKGYYMNNYTQPQPNTMPTSYLARPQNHPKPFFNSKNFKTNNIKGSYMWLFSKKR